MDDKPRRQGEQIMDAQKITPCIWFEDKCEEAVNFYVEVFNGNPNKKEDSGIELIQRYEEGMQTPGIEQMVGKVLTVVFNLDGTKFMALDGGPGVFKMSGAISFLIEPEDQEETDYFWQKLSAVPEAEACGWLQDKYGVTWQVSPKRLGELLQDPDKEKAHRVMNAMLQMKKIDIAELNKAYEGR
jgi:predicted 3-demethylubiquinone-9 3-methyltransferase (glyoxalase superfamily)